MKTKKTAIILISLLLSVLLLTAGVKGVFTSSDDTDEVADKESVGEQIESKTDKQESDSKNETKKQGDSKMEHSKVKVTMENGGAFVIELYPEFAPATVENFLSLVNDGFYNGLTFHRIVDNFMAQGGSSDGKGYEGSKKTIKGEFASNGFSQNTLSHTRGVISMARSQFKDSASSQFFICYSDRCGFLDGDYAAFGKVIEGMEVVDGFCELERTYNSMGEKAIPVEPVVIKTMVVE